MKSRLSIALGFFLSFSAAAKLAPFCEREKKDLWQITYKGPEDFKILAGHEFEEYNRDHFYGNPVSLNDDKFQDLWLNLGDCDRGGLNCFEVLLAGCGDDRHYAFVAERPEQDFQIDTRHGVNVEGTHWYDITYRTQQKEGKKRIALGWRLRFNGKDYKLTFLHEEYASLIKEAHKGRVFALEQLAAVAYPILRDHPEAPELKDFRATLMERSFLKRVLGSASAYLTSFPKEVREDRELVLTGAEGKTIIFVGDLTPSLRDDKEIARHVLKHVGRALEHFGPTVRADAELVEIAVKSEKYSFQHAGENLRADRSLLIKFSKLYGISAKGIADNLKDDKALARIMMAHDVESYIFFHDSVRMDPEIAKAALSQRSYLMKWVPALKNNKSIIYAAVQGGAGFIEELDPKLFDDSVFVLALVCRSQDVYQYLPEKIRNNRELALIATWRYPSMLFNAPKSFKEDRRFVLEVVKGDPYVYMDLPEKLLADKEIAREVFSKASAHWYRAPPEITGDAEIAALVTKVEQFPKTEFHRPFIQKACEKAKTY